MSSRKSKSRVRSAPPPEPKPQLPFRGLWFAAGIACILAVTAVVFRPGSGSRDGADEVPRSEFTLQEIPFNGQRAYEYLKQVCQLGRRPSGSEGMVAQQKLLEAHFQKLGATVHRQKFEYPHPQNGQPVPITNLIIQWAPERSERILLACHYDTLPNPMLDTQDPFGEFVGANDGGSGVAILMELGHAVAAILAEDQLHFGVDFVFLDAEEFIFKPRGGRYFVGSEYFSRQYVAGQLPYRANYRWGVLLDMVGDSDLQIPQEANGRWWEDCGPLVEEIYGTAERLGVREFVPRRGTEIQDDHIMLHNLGKIPTIDLIDFDYPPWHTMGDTPDKCSALSLAKVGWVVREWLKQTGPAAPSSSRATSP